MYYESARQDGGGQQVSVHVAVTPWEEPLARLGAAADLLTSLLFSLFFLASSRCSLLPYVDTAMYPCVSLPYFLSVSLSVSLLFRSLVRICRVIVAVFLLSVGGDRGGATAQTHSLLPCKRAKKDGLRAERVSSRSLS